MRRTPAAPLWRWMWSLTVEMAGPARFGGGEQGEGLRRGAGGPVVGDDAMPAARRTQVLAQQLAGARVEEADVAVVLVMTARASTAGCYRTVETKRLTLVYRRTRLFVLTLAGLGGRRRVSGAPPALSPPVARAGSIRTGTRARSEGARVPVRENRESVL